MYPLSVACPIFQSLREIDHDIFLAAKAQGCQFCEGPLDTANYWRKTRGMTAGDLLQ